MTNFYVIIKNQSEYLTVEVPSLCADKCWVFKPNHTPNFDSSAWYIKGSPNLKAKVVYPEQFAHLTLFEYMQTYHPEHLI
jgi:hypothetical protein